MIACAFLALIGAMYCRGNIDDWLQAEMRAFIFESLPIPYWGATLAMPIGFGLMGARFLATTINAGSTADPADAHGVTDRLGTSEEAGA